MKRILTFLFLLTALAALASAQDTLMLTGSSATSHTNYRVAPPYNPTSKVASMTVSNSSTTATLNNFVWLQNGSNEVFNAEGDSITQTPNGAGVTSWFGIIATGTYPGASFFNGHGTAYDNAIGGSVISNGTATGLYTVGNPANMPQTCTVAAYSTGATTLTVTSTPLTGSLAPPPNTPGGASTMVVVGPGIPFGTSGTVNGPGTVITLSKATTTGGSGAIYLGGNNCMDRWSILDYPNSPVATGNTNACFYFVMAGANSLRCGESAPNMIADMLALSSTAKAAGYIPVISTILPTVNLNNSGMWWNNGAITNGTNYFEYARRQYNAYVRGHNFSGCIVVDPCEVFSGDYGAYGAVAGGWRYYDINGIHPVGAANAMIAEYINSVMLVRGAVYNGVAEVVDSYKEFPQWVQFDLGNTTPNNYNTTSIWLLNQPNLPVSQGDYMFFGRDSSGSDFGAGFLAWDQDSTNQGHVEFGMTNSNPFVFQQANGEQLDIGYTRAQALAQPNTALSLSSYNAAAVLAGQNTYTNCNQYLDWMYQPNLTSPNFTYGRLLGTAGTANNAGGLSFMNQGAGSALNAIGLFMVGQSGPTLSTWFFSDGGVIVSGTTELGNAKLDVRGNTAIGAVSTQRIIFTGTTGATPATPGTVNAWETVIVNGTTDYIPVYH